MSITSCEYRKLNVFMNKNSKNSLAPVKFTLLEKIRGWRLGFSLDIDTILKAVICAFLLVFFCLLQTTLFTKFRPFGAVPDLILPLTVAFALSEKERWGAVLGLIGAVVIESLGGSTVTLMPLLYTFTGYICGILAVNYFRDSVATRFLFTVVTSFVKICFTLIVLFATTGDATLPTAIMKCALPELLACVVFAPLPHLTVKLALHHFNKPREARVE